MMASMETTMEYRQPTEDELVPAAQAGVQDPTVCPKCKSPYWDRPRKVKKSKPK